MINLSVNVNKVATLRNSRGRSEPSVIEAVRVCARAGAPGITVHPRADQRHITPTDVRQVKELLNEFPHVEYNIEGDPRPELIDMVQRFQPTQCTLVPVQPGEITSQGGWPEDTPAKELRAAIESMKKLGVRVSLFVDARPDAVRWAADMGGDRVELYTEPFARAFENGRGAESFQEYAAAAESAAALGLGVNAGHDLNLGNLPLFRELPHLAEVSIGHALMSHALYVGLEQSVRDYLDALR